MSIATPDDELKALQRGLEKHRARKRKQPSGSLCNCIVCADPKEMARADA